MVLPEVFYLILGLRLTRFHLIVKVARLLLWEVQGYQTSPIDLRRLKMMALEVGVSETSENHRSTESVLSVFRRASLHPVVKLKAATTPGQFEGSRLGHVSTLVLP